MLYRLQFSLGRQINSLFSFVYICVVPDIYIYFLSYVAFRRNKRLNTNSPRGMTGSSFKLRLIQYWIDLRSCSGGTSTERLSKKRGGSMMMLRSGCSKDMQFCIVTYIPRSSAACSNSGISNWSTPSSAMYYIDERQMEGEHDSVGWRRTIYIKPQFPTKNYLVVTNNVIQIFIQSLAEHSMSTIGRQTHESIFRKRQLDI